MPKKKEQKNLFEGFSFITGAVRFKDLGYIVVSNDSLAKKEVAHSQLIVWSKGEWSDLGTKNWLTHAIAIAKKPLQQMIVVSEFGQVVATGSKDVHEEEVRDGEISTEGRGPLRRAANIGNSVYVCGMNRQVYKRVDANKWVCIDKSMRPADKEGVVGFEAIAGLSEDDIYAVGWEGEIWHYDGAKWQKEKSPTKLILTGVAVADGGIVYACGQMGTIIKKENGEWKIVAKKENPQDDLWDIKWFRGKLYISSMSWLVVYNEQKDSLEPVDFGTLNPQTFYHLSVADGIFWSIGAKDILSFDGKKWSRVFSA